MRIAEVHAQAFGPLIDAHLELRPRMNVIFGPNEAGKSSWHAALSAALCGIRRGSGPPRKEDQRSAELYRPWTSQSWKVRCVVALSDGRRVELRDDLDNLDGRAIDLYTGQQLTDDDIIGGINWWMNRGQIVTQPGGGY